MVLERCFWSSIPSFTSSPNFQILASYWQAWCPSSRKILFWQLVSTCDIQVIVKHKMQRREIMKYTSKNEQIWKQLQPTIIASSYRSGWLSSLVCKHICRHWQESRSREILEEKWFRFFSLAREKLIFMSRSPLDFQESEDKFLFLLSIVKTWKTFLCLFETYFSFSSRFSRFWRKISLSPLDFQDFGVTTSGTTTTAGWLLNYQFGPILFLLKMDFSLRGSSCVFKLHSIIAC